MIEFGRVMTFECQQNFQLSEKWFEDVADLLTMVERHKEVGEKITVKDKIFLSLAALRATIIRLRADKVVEKWDHFLSSDEIENILQGHKTKYLSPKEELESILAVYRRRVDFLESLSRLLASLAAEVAYSEVWDKEQHQQIISGIMESIDSLTGGKGVQDE